MRQGIRLIFIAAISVLGPGDLAWGLSSADSAWFLDSSRLVKYCLTVAPDFSLSESEIQPSVDWALSQWVSYMNTMKLQERPPRLQLARQFQKTSNCDQADLKLLFGVQNSDIDQYRKEDFFHPVAFARRLQSNPLTGWSQGILWVSGDQDFSGDSQTGSVSWKDHLRLKGVLLHELGHVFGVGHWAGTIMRDDILNSLLGGSDIYGLTHITNSWELMSPLQDSWVNGDQYNQLGEMSADAFFKLIGRAPQGPIHAQWLVSQRQILVQDDLSQYVLNLSFVFERVNQDAADKALFFAYRKDTQGNEFTQNERRESFIKIGTISSLSGEKLHVVVEKNLADRHVSISFQLASDQVYIPLFAQPCVMQNVPFHTPVCFPVYPKDEG